MANIIISPSLLAADFSKLNEEIARVEVAGANYLHLDVMDGQFVPNISFGIPVVSSIRKCTRLKFDVHLMIQNPLNYIDPFVRAGADIITFHYESQDPPLDVIREIRAHDLPSGMAISPKTPVEAVFPFLHRLGMVLVMTVEPGYGGQALIPETLEKVRVIRKYIQEHNLSVNVEVDGGINSKNIDQVVAAGANVIVAGSAIFNAKKAATVIRNMRESCLSI